MEEWPEEMDTRIEQETTLRWRRLRDHYKWRCNSYRRCDALSFYYKYTPLKEV
jgi:hypothetical protein